jgi:crossover junction endodeoxyribonuclease RusA
MSKPITLVLPYPPATNNLYFSFVTKDRKIIRVPTDRAKKFKADVARQCQQLDVKPFIGEVSVSLDVFRPRRVGDLDGTFKIVFDSLKGFAFNDDKQIVEILAKRHDDKDRPRVEIQISPLGLY